MIFVWFKHGNRTNILITVCYIVIPDIDELFETYASSESYPSYSYYEEAAATETPGYRVEKAKSGRSSCKSKTGKQICGGLIPKDSIRVGSLEEKAGGYSRWHHLTSAETRGVGGPCKGWRVPKKVWSGLTNPSDLNQSLIDLLNMEEVLLCGLASLDGASQREFAQHCVQEENWAQHKRKASGGGEKERKKSKTEVASGVTELTVANASDAGEEAEEEDQKPAAEASSGYSLANPDSADTVDPTFLKSHSFIITGSFPELVITGATKAKDAGVGDVKVLIESFGGKVASRFSKKTSEFSVDCAAVFTIMIRIHKLILSLIFLKATSLLAKTQIVKDMLTQKHVKCPSSL